MNKYLLLTLLIISIWACSVVYAPTPISPPPIPVMDPTPIDVKLPEPEPFHSKPIMMDSGLILCADWSVWRLVQVAPGGPIVAELIIPPSEKAK